jgi:hypothetical protein
MTDQSDLIERQRLEILRLKNDLKVAQETIIVLEKSNANCNNTGSK